MHGHLEIIISKYNIFPDRLEDPKRRTIERRALSDL